MGKITGYLEWERQLPEKRDKSKRIQDYQEFYLEQSEEQSRHQAGRCMDCGVPFCQQGCPLGNLIPDWNDLVYRGRWESAYRALSSTNNFPEFTGRLCPAPCEAACTLAINVDAVTIEQMEKDIIEHAYAHDFVKPVPARTKTGKRAAVVGSGPAGMAAAQQLARAGHEVDLFEKSDRIGGLLRYGIPDFKMEKWVIDRRMTQMEAEGVNFKTSVNVGEDITWDTLTNDYDAVIVSVGAMRARDLQAEGRDVLKGVHFAMDFLEQQNREVAGDEQTPAERIHAKDKHVIILGGGDTGSDCLGTSLRHGAKSVKQIELFPAPPEKRELDNPWPQWPIIFKTSSSQAEGGERHFALMTKRLEGDADGNIKKLHASRVEVLKDAEGRTTLKDTGDEVSLDCDLLLLAMGYTGPLADDIKDQLGVELTGRGTIAGDDKFRTNIDNVYVAGDAYRGASLIVWAISDGREAARTADADMMGKERLPTRGLHQPYGGR